MILFSERSGHLFYEKDFSTISSFKLTITINERKNTL